MAEDKKFLMKGEEALTLEQFKAKQKAGLLIPGKKYYLTDIDIVIVDSETVQKDEEGQLVAVGLKNEDDLTEILKFKQISEALTITIDD